jgi:hypothetical protein
MDPFNALSTAAAVRKIPPLKEASPTKVMLCVLVTLTDLQKDLNAAKEVTGGADTPSAKMFDRAANSPGRSAMVCGQSAPHDEGRSPPACQGSPCTQVRGMRLTHALSPRPMFGKEHRLDMPTRPTTGILTLSKVAIRRQLVVPSSSSNDDLPLVKHDAQVDLNPGSARIRYPQEPALVSNSPLLSLPPYIVSV